ncbi:MAG: tetratricopeptide repeat protein [Alphaproteobacteria bacterium]|nr:tetratricopeptide repeat protein [Alphaproteobacteria bacterium]
MGTGPKQLLPGLGGVAPKPAGPRIAHPVQAANAAVGRGDLGEAMRILDAARTTHGADPEIWRMRALCLFKAQRYRAAVDAFDAACERHPNHLPTLISFGDAAMAMGRADRAVEIYGYAVGIDPENRAALLGKAQATLTLGHFAEAEEQFRRLTGIFPDDRRSWIGLGRSLDGAGRLAEALESFETVLASADDDLLGVETSAASLLIRLGRAEDALPRLDRVLALAPSDRVAWSLKAVALGRCGKVAAARETLGVDSLVDLKALPLPHGYVSMDVFNAELVAAAEAHPTLAGPRPEMPMSHGRKTGNLEADHAPVFKVLRGALEAVFARHVEEMRSIGHPYLAHMPERWRLSLWANILTRQGEIGAHIHKAAWFSGAYYAEMPEEPADPGSRAGWIEVGRPRDDLAGDDWPATRFVQSRTGHLVLFPSYVYHRTVPFEGTGRRVSFGFDFIPL